MIWKVRHVASSGDGVNDHSDVEEDKKVLCQVLGRLDLPETVDDDKIRTLKLLVQNVFTVRSDSLLLPSFTP